MAGRWLTFDCFGPLVEAIQRFRDHWNDDCRPFVGVKTADEILASPGRHRP
jgi:hypothetical protein